MKTGVNCCKHCGAITNKYDSSSKPQHKILNCGKCSEELVSSKPKNQDYANTGLVGRKVRNTETNNIYKIERTRIVEYGAMKKLLTELVLSNGNYTYLEDLYSPNCILELLDVEKQKKFTPDITYTTQPIKKGKHHIGENNNIIKEEKKVMRKIIKKYGKPESGMYTQDGSKVDFSATVGVNDKLFCFFSGEDLPKKLVGIKEL